MDLMASHTNRESLLLMFDLDYQEEKLDMNNPFEIDD